MKIPRVIRTIAFVTCAIFTFSAVVNAAPIQTRDKRQETIDHSQPVAENEKSLWSTVYGLWSSSAQVVGPMKDLAPQPLSQVLAWLQDLIDKADDPQKAAAYAHSFFKRTYGTNKRIDSLVALRRDKDKMKELGLTDEEMQSLIRETQQVTIRLREGTLQKGRKAGAHTWTIPRNRKLEQVRRSAKSKKVSSLLKYKNEKEFRGSVKVRSGVIEELEKIGTAEAYDAIATFYDDPDWRVCRDALTVLRKLDADSVNLARVSAFLKDSDSRVKIDAVQYCGVSRSAQGVQYLEPLLFLPNSRVQDATLRALRANGSQTALELLWKMTFSADPRTQREAREAYYDVFAQLHATNDAEVWEELVEIKKIVEAKNYLGLVPYLNHGDWIVVSEALFELAETKAEETVPAIAALFSSRANKGYEWYAMHALTRIGGKKVKTVYERALKRKEGAVPHAVIKRELAKVKARLQAQKKKRKGKRSSTRTLKSLLIVTLSASVLSLVEKVYAETGAEVGDASMFDGDVVWVLAVGLFAFFGAHFVKGVLRYREKRNIKRTFSLYDFGIEAYEKGDFATAIQFLEEANSIMPDQYRIALYLGLAYSENGEYVKAENLFSLLQSHELADEVLYFNFGLVLWKQKKTGMAYVAWKMALDIDPDFKPAAEILQSIEKADDYSAASFSWNDYLFVKLDRAKSFERHLILDQIAKLQSERAATHLFDRLHAALANKDKRYAEQLMTAIGANGYSVPGWSVALELAHGLGMSDYRLRQAYTSMSAAENTRSTGMRKRKREAGSVRLNVLFLLSLVPFIGFLIGCDQHKSGEFVETPIEKQATAMSDSQREKILTELSSGIWYLQDTGMHQAVEYQMQEAIALIRTIALSSDMSATRVRAVQALRHFKDREGIVSILKKTNEHINVLIAACEAVEEMKDELFLFHINNLLDSTRSSFVEEAALKAREAIVDAKPRLGNQQGSSVLEVLGMLAAFGLLGALLGVWAGYGETVKAWGEVLAFGAVIGVIGGALIIGIGFFFSWFHNEYDLFRSKAGISLLLGLLLSIIIPTGIYYKAASNEQHLSEDLQKIVSDGAYSQNGLETLVSEGIESDDTQTILNSLVIMRELKLNHFLPRVLELGGETVNKDVRVAVYRTCGVLRAAEAVPFLTERLYGDPDGKEATVAIVEALQAIDSDDSQTVLDEAIGYEKNREVREAVYGVKRQVDSLTADQDIRRLVADLKLIHHEDAYVISQRALRALQKYGARTEPYLARELSNPLHRVRLIASEVLIAMDRYSEKMIYIKLEADLRDLSQIYSEGAASELKKRNAYTPERQAMKHVGDFVQGVMRYDVRMKKRAEDALVVLGKVVVPELMRAITSSDVSSEAKDEVQRLMQEIEKKTEESSLSSKMLQTVFPLIGFFSLVSFTDSAHATSFPTGVIQSTMGVNGAVYPILVGTILFFGIKLLQRYKNFFKYVFFVRMANYYKGHELYSDAIQYYVRAENAGVLPGREKYALAECYQKISNYDLAVGQYHLAADALGYTSQILVGMTKVYYAKNDYGNVLYWGKKVIDGNPYDYEIYQLVIEACEKHDDFDAAEDYFTEMVTRQKENGEAVLADADSAYLAKMNSRKTTRIKELYLEAAYLYDHQKYSASLDLFGKIMRMDPLHVGAYVYSAKNFLAQKQTSLASVYVEQALKINATDRLALLTLEEIAQHEAAEQPARASLTVVNPTVEIVREENENNQQLLRKYVTSFTKKLHSVQYGDTDYERLNTKHLTNAVVWGDLESLGLYRSADMSPEAIRGWFDFKDWDLPLIFMHDRTFVSPVALKNRLVLEGTLLHEHIHSVLRDSGYSESVQDTIAGVIELRYLFVESMAIDKEEGLSFGKSFQEIVAFLKDARGENRITADLEHLLNRYSHYQGSFLEQTIQAIVAIAEMRNGDQQVDIPIEDIADLIESIENEVLVSGSFTTRIDQLRNEMLVTSVDYMIAAGLTEAVLHEKRIVLIDDADDVDTEIVMPFISDTKKVFTYRKGVSGKSGSMLIEVTPEGKRFLPVMTFSDAINRLRIEYPEFTISVVSADDDRLRTVTSSAIERFSTEYAHQIYAEANLAPAHFESLIVPFLLNIDRETLLDEYEGAGRLFLKRSGLWKVNPEYIATLDSSSLANAVEVLRSSIRDAIQRSIAERAIQTAA